MHRPEGSIRRVDVLEPLEIDEMFALMEKYYCNVLREQFLADLGEKDYVILLKERDTGEVCGFSTQVVIKVPEVGPRVHVLFSGDTVIDQRHWNANPLAGLWGELTLRLAAQHPGDELYWLLLSKGFRTYRYLPVFFREFWPRHDGPTPERMQQVMSRVMERKYGTRFDSAAGIVRAEHYFLRMGASEITEGRTRDPHVGYFLGRNPGFIRGDELCCIAPLHPANFKPAAYRLMGSRGAGKAPEAPDRPE